MPDPGIVVLGAGPAGLTAACELRRLGYPVLVIAPDLPPAPRVETLATRAEQLADAMGLGPVLAAASLGRVARSRLAWRAQDEVIAHGTAAPLLLDRRRFAATLRTEAEQRGVGFRTARASRITPDAETLSIDTDQGPVRARLVIDARGRAAHRPGDDTALAALPFRAVATAPGQPELWLAALPEAWLWAAIGPGGQVQGALHLAAGRLAGGAAGDVLSTALRQSAGFRDLRLTAIGRPCPAFPASAPVLANPICWRIGDRAVAQDPISGQGLAWALRSAGHAAVAAHTVLSGGADDAARAFLADRQAEALRASAQSRARLYADQARFKTPFWAGSGPQDRTAMPLPDAILSLTAPLIAAAVLETDAIRWGEALALPDGSHATWIGQLSARDLAHILRDPASLATHATRLKAITGPDAAEQVIAQLLAKGAFATG